MCVFYRRFSGYLNHKFDDIYSMKIDSDILGMASATYDCRETVGPVWLQNKLDTFYHMLSGEQWVDYLKKLLDQGESVWIYGTSTLAAICKRSLEQAGLQVKGFVVSDGYSKMDIFENCVVKYISETKGKQ